MAKKIPNVQELGNSRKMAEVIEYLLNKHGINVVTLSQSINLPSQTVYRILTGKTADPQTSTVIAIADYFKVSVDQLIGRVDIENNEIKSKNEVFSPIYVPVIDWEKSLNYKDFLEYIKSNEWKNFVCVDKQNVDSKYSFALKTKKSMSYLSPEGTIVVINPNKTPVDGSLVLVHYENTDEPTLRELVLDGPEKKLFGPKNIADNFDSTKHIIGVVVKNCFNYE